MNKKKYLYEKRIVLIHGFGTSVPSELIATVTKGVLKFEQEDKGFKAFNELISQGNAKVFSWNEAFNAKELKEYASVQKYIDLYYREKKKALSDNLQSTFTAFIEKEQPEVIVAHSMGCYLVLGYLDKFDLPKSVKKIFLIQGDFDKKYELKNKAIIKRIENDDLRLINIFCPWDTTLIFSPFINKLVLPAGLVRMRNPYFVDVLFPLGNDLNLHNSSIQSSDLLDFVLKY